MTRTIFSRPALALLVFLVRVLEAAADETALRQRIVGLVQQLGADKFALRETAQRQLVALGEPALPLVREATESDDLEVRKRAKDIELTILMSCRVGKSSGVQLALVMPGEFSMGSPPTEQYRFTD